MPRAIARVEIKQTEVVTVEFSYSEYYYEMKKSDMEYTDEQINKLWKKLIKKETHTFTNKTVLDNRDDPLEHHLDEINNYLTK